MISTNTLRASIVVAIVLGFAAERATATDVTINSATSASAIQAAISGGGGTGTITFTGTATLTMDAGLINVTGIIVNNTFTGTIDFAATTNRIVFADAAGAITLNGNSQLTISGTNSAAGIDFATTAGTAAARTLTITSSSSGSLSSSVAANNLYLGRGNTVVFASSGGAADALNSVTIANNTAAPPIIDVNATLAFNTLVISMAGDDVDFDIADGLTATVSNAFTTAGATIIELIAVTGGGTETLHFGGGLTLAGSSTLRFTNDSGAVSGTVTSGADTVTIDVNGTATLATLTPTNSINLDLAAGKTLTISNAVTVPAAKVVTFTGTNDASAETLAINGGLNLNGAAAELNVVGDLLTPMVVSGTVTGATDGGILDLDAASTTITSVTMTNDTGDLTLQVGANVLSTAIDVNNNTLTIAEAGGGTIAAVQLDTPGGTIDLNTAKTITNVTATLTSGTATYEAAVPTSGAINVSGNGGTLVFTETGTVADLNITGAGTARIAANLTITDIDWTSAGTLDVDQDVTVTNADLASNGTIDVAAGKTLTATNGVTVNTNNLSLSGSGAITRVNVSSGTITDNGGTTISDLRATFGSGGTFTWTGTGDGTVTTMTNALPSAGETFNKTGNGSVTLTGGFTTAFANAAGAVLDIDAGTVILGAPGSNDDITFDDDADEITVASGATLTTYGSFTVGAAGTNVNVDAAVGSTVNLGSTAGPETFTASANDDFNLLGTVIIGGSNGDYNIADAFDYKFGSLNINTTGSLINNNPGGEMTFVSGASVTLTGGATFTVNGQAASTPIILDTTDGTGTFTIDRAGSNNFTLANVDLRRAAIIDNTGAPADCDIIFTDVTLTDVTLTDVTVTDATGFAQTCDGGEQTDGDTGIGDGFDGDIASDEPVVGDAGDDGVADLANDHLDVRVDGLDVGTSVKLVTDADGETTVTVGDTDNPDLVVMLTGSDQGAEVSVSLGADGHQTLVVTNVDGTEIVSIDIIGLGDNPVIEAVIGDSSDQIILLRDVDGASFSFGLAGVPTGAAIGFESTVDGGVEVDILDPSGDAVGVAVNATNVFRTFGVTVTYAPLPDAVEGSGRVVPGFDGLEGDQSLGGGVMLAATGLTTDSVVAVGLNYTDADVAAAGVTPSALRLTRLNASTSKYEVAGELDQGDVAPTGVLGDYGVHTDANTVWAEVTQLGQFAVGVPKITQSTEDTGVGCASGGMCGTMGFMCLPMCFAGSIGMKRRFRRRL